MLQNLAKLEKMCIAAYSEGSRSRAVRIGHVEVMFNPASYKRSVRVGYVGVEDEGIGQQSQEANYTHTAPSRLSMTMVFDGTGVHRGSLDTAVTLGSVKARIETFEKLCLNLNGAIHQPNFLQLIWGRLIFDCRLESLDINYTLFDESGDPLRAELSVSFVEDKMVETAAKEEARSSPDLTHVRVVQAGDTLPLLCRSVYGSSRHYLLVAGHNGLDDFRQLRPGQRLAFPPLPVAGGPPA